MTRIAMISGHLDLTQEEFDEHYRQLIRDAYERGDLFIIGDAPGADTMAQKYLNYLNLRFGFRSNVTIYHMFTSPRNNVANMATKGGYTKDSGKDAAMTADSDYDIAWVRPSKHSSVSGRVSGTEQNIIRRKAKS